VEIHTPARGIHGFDLRSLEIEAEAFHPRNAPGKHALLGVHVLRADASQFSSEFGVNRCRRRLVILLRRTTDVEEWVRAVKLHIPPFQFSEFPTTQLGFERRQIGRPS